jgi:carnitine 3-dehydrogenase
VAISDKSINKVCVVGAGVIGSGWASRCLARGLDVVATDPGVGAEDIMRGHVANAWPALEQIGLADGAGPERLSFEPDLDKAVAQADFVQENSPEDEDVKRRVISAIDGAAAGDVLIASSSSGLLPTRIQSDCQQPERVLIGHPFNPVYILPLVEIVGGEKTADSALDRAARFYANIGMRPLMVKKEIAGYVSDRLQEAMFREAMHIIAEGVATTEEVDAAITDGPGMRLAWMGPMFSFHLGAGYGGMRYHFDHYGMDQPWTNLEAPPLTDELVGRMVDGTLAQQGAQSFDEWLQARDRFLLQLHALKKELVPGY